MSSRQEQKEERRQERINQEEARLAEPNIDTKYGRVTTQYGEFIDGEPVIVFRARDGLTDVLLGIYRELCNTAGSPTHHLDLIDQTRQRFVEWQAQNRQHVQVPNSNRYMARTGQL